MNGGPLWRGLYVELVGRDDWRFYRCLRCDKELSAPNQEGYGPECKSRRPLDWRSERRKALKTDRTAYARARDPYIGPAPTQKQLAYLGYLAVQKGLRTPQVRSKGEASRAIKELLKG